MILKLKMSMYVASNTREWIWIGMSSVRMPWKLIRNLGGVMRCRPNWPVSPKRNWGRWISMKCLDSEVQFTMWVLEIVFRGVELLGVSHIVSIQDHCSKQVVIICWSRSRH